jgi:thioester reductase-like protein
LWGDEVASRIVAVPGDLARPLLGIGAQAFDALCKVIDVIYHNGALVNFILPYANLKDPNVRGTEEVIRLACSVKRKPLHFISTIGVFPPATDANAKVLESDPVSNWQGLVEGYRQSKWVAEKIVKIAAARGLPVRIYRPGFVTGDSTTGVWNTDDLLPRLIKGCIQLGIIPESNAMIEMVPVDYVSKTIVHLSRQQELRSNVFHVVSPTYIPAKELGDIVRSLGFKMKLVPYLDWRNALLEDAKTSTKNALFPLLTMFTEASPLEQVQAFDCRETLEGLRGTQLVCPEISTNLMATYLAYFERSGFLAA